MSETFHVSIHEAGHCVIACILGRGMQPKMGATIVPRGHRLGGAYTKRGGCHKIEIVGSFAGVLAERLAETTEELSLDGDFDTIVGSLLRERLIPWQTRRKIWVDPDNADPEIMRLWAMASVAGYLMEFGSAAAGWEDTLEYKFMRNAANTARRVLSENWDAVMRVSNALEEKKTLSGAEVENLVRPDLVGRIYKRPRSKK